METETMVTAPAVRLNAILRGEAGAASGRVLVVEDDDTNRELIAEVLIDEGCEVQTAKHGMAALEVLATWQPDLILLDLRMPGMSGYEFAEHYRQHPTPHAPIVLMTASFEGEIETARQTIGAVGTISKPFDLDDLLAIVGQFSPCIS